jgi:nitrile hydratase subunit alpha
MNDLFHYDNDREANSAAKVRALEALLIKKGVLGSDSIDAVLSHFETVAGPFNGAKIVARAWTDPEFKKRLLENTPEAIKELNFPLGMDGAEGEHMKAVANSQSVHNLVICTLCSCYPWPVLGCRLIGTRIRSFARAACASQGQC